VAASASNAALTAGGHSGDGLVTISYLAPAQTTTAVTASPATSTPGQPVTLTASVSSSSTAVSGGTVQFTVDGSNLGAPVPVTGGAASTSIATLPVGVHVIQGFYSGAPGFGPSSGVTAAAVGSPPAATSGGGGSGGVTVAPQDSTLSLSAVRFRAASAGPSVASARSTGTQVTYTDTEAATTIFSVIRKTAGVQRGGKCIAASRHPKKPAKRCTKLVTVGSFQHLDSAGANSFRFTGRVGGRKLKPGSYELIATPINSSHQLGSPRRKDFRIIP
jgi:hypothetical protein